MKKHNSVQGTFSRLFGKKHASNNSTSSLFATNPPWIFTQEVNSDSLKTSGEVDGIYYGGNRFGSMTDSGTATLKPRPRVRPLLTFLPLDAQETHGVAVPTPSVPESFEDKLPAGSQINGNYRKYNSVIDLRTKAFGEDYLDDDCIPPPPSIPPPSPPPLSVDLPPVSSSVVVPPPPSMVAPPPPPMTPPPPPPMTPPPPPPSALPAPWLSSMAAPSFPYSDVCSPSTPTPPDFIPPPPPPPPPPPDFMDTAISSIPPISLPVHTQLFSNGVSKWKSETVLNIHNPSLNSPATPIHKELPQSSPEPHLTFPKSLKVPPPTPMRTSSIFSGEKDSSPKEHFPRMTSDSHSPLLPTIQCATIDHSEAEARAKTNMGNHSALVTESKTSDSKICPLKKKQNLSWSTEERTEFSSPGYASSDDDIWNERCNLDKLKNELSTLLSSTCRKEDRPTEKITFSKSKGTDIDSNNVTTDELKLVKHNVKKTHLPQRAENEKKEKKCANNSPAKSFTKDAFSTADKFPTTQGNCAMKLKEELEALLSPVKEGGPPFAIANLRHNPETRKQVTLQFSGNKVNNGELKFPTAKLEGTEKEATMPSPSVHTCKPPVSSLKSQSEHLAPATSSSSNSETTLPTQTASPSKDLSLKYKTHRSKSDSVDSLVFATSSQAIRDGLSSSCINENQRDFTGNMPSTTAKLSRNAEPLSSDVLFHPVTGEKVEKGSPMALLLAAQMRANRGKCSASASQNNSSLLEKPQLKLNNSSQSENGLSTIYYSNSKPNTIKVVPKSPHKDLLAESESKQCNESSASNNNIRSLSGQSENMPQISSNVTEQCRSTLKFRETNDSQSLSSNKCDSSILLQNSNSSHLKQQDPLNRSEIPFHFFPPPQNHTVKNDEVEEGFNYEIIPPPPEFSNDTSEIPKFSSDTQISDMQLNFNNSSYNYGNSYSLTSAVQRPSDYSHHYPGDSYTSNYLSSCSNSRPLIKKRLYLSETDDLYSRTAMSARNMSIPNSYGYNSSAVEGIHRANYSHRNIPNSTQGRRVSLEIPGKIITYNTSVNDFQYKSQNGAYSTNAIASGRSCHVSPQYGTLNTFTVRPGTRQPISYSYQGLH